MKSERHLAPPSEQKVVIARRLALLQRLMRAPATHTELLQIVADDQNLPESRVRKRFEEDRKQLREVFGCDLVFNRANAQYELRGMDRALIDLSDEALRGLAFLQATFSNAEAVSGDDVRALIDQITRLLSNERRHDLARTRGGIELRLQPRDDDDIGEEVWEVIRAACGEKRQLQFDYRSPGQSDGAARRHIVEPHRYYFDTTHQHYYLEAFWRESSGPQGRHLQEKWQTFRLGRIRNPHLLPSHFTTRQSRRSYELVYILSAEVARLGVSRLFDEQQHDPQEDGSAIVKVQSRDLFTDLRALLHYGPACRVVGGEEAVRQMWALVEGMLMRYKE